MTNAIESFRPLVERVVRESGIDFFGIARIGDEARNFHQLPAALVSQLPLAVVIAKSVSPAVLDTIEDGPTLIYYHHYRQVNQLLDRAALKLASAIEGAGYLALAVAASQLVDWKNQLAHVSHKKLAEMAGLGWHGRNNLLVTRQFGARVRLASVLTNLPLEPSPPDGSAGCGRCRRCLDVCPAGAIKEKVADFDHMGCYKQLDQFRKTHGVGQHICGICVRACPGDGHNG